MRLSAITLFVEDLPRTRLFYQDALGLEMVFEDDDSTAFDLAGTVINLLRVSAADELIEPAAVGGGDAGSRFQLTIEVPDVDAACAELATKGLEPLNGPMDRPWGVRTACFADPAGHLWEFAAPLERDSPAS
jgi:catechol 2,3-dioxygenase-like lactoylglutathione lyase family enzyme